MAEGLEIINPIQSCYKTVTSCITAQDRSVVRIILIQNLKNVWGGDFAPYEVKLWQKTVAYFFDSRCIFNA